MLINICEREIFKKDNKKKDGYIYQLDIDYINRKKQANRKDRLDVLIVCAIYHNYSIQ